MSRLPGAHQHIALVPQWDFLDMLADAAAEEPTFTLRRNAEVDRRCCGTATGSSASVYRDRVTGERHELRADLTVACDGRGSAVRAAAGLRPRSFGVPMDVWWFRLSRRPGRPERRSGPVLPRPLLRDDRPRGLLAVRLPDQQGHRRRAARRGHRGAAATLRRSAALDGRPGRRADLVGRRAPAQRPAGAAAPVVPRRPAADRRRRARHVAGRRGRASTWPWPTRWPRPGCSPRRCGPGHGLSRAQLARVQLRRWWPTALVQGAQRLVHRVVLGPVLADPAAGLAATAETPRPPRRRAGWTAAVPTPPAPLDTLPLPLRLLQRFPVLQGIPARLVAIGPLPEHAPAWARRTPSPDRRHLSPQRDVIAIRGGTPGS